MKNSTQRLLLYICIAGLTTLQIEFNSITELLSQGIDIPWTTYAGSLLKVVIPTLVAWRAFIDQSLTKENITGSAKYYTAPNIPENVAENSTLDNLK